VKLIILHCHFRPGGVRRVIELATPPLVRALNPVVTEVVLAGGEPPDDGWTAHFRGQLRGVGVSCWIESALGYVAEQSLSLPGIRQRVRRFFRQRLDGLKARDCLVWAHNQSLGRNLLLTRELARQCAACGIRLVLHHHDWWFDNRWQRWSELRRAGFRSFRQAAEAVFVHAPNVRHATINRSDFATLHKHLGPHAGWLPNLMPRVERPSVRKGQGARRWLDGVLGDHNAPVWLVPCRLLRRKNFAEALLLARWLRPEAWLVTTGGVSSDDESAYAEKLAAAARKHGWRLRLGALAGEETRKPSVPELLAASEVVLLTSLQEGFGLPYLEAAIARRPMIGRILPNIAPDLRTFGFRFPQAYEELRVPTTLFDWERERARQTLYFQSWLRVLPRALRRQVGVPVALASRRPPPALPFSRLTLTAQLEVLAQPLEESWHACLALNPFLESWRQRAGKQKLQVTPWPRTADRWLGPRAYATRFLKLLRARRPFPVQPGYAQAAQSELVTKAFATTNQYPLLWRTHT
jgi:glycosyltransferase involved in cell wall biosynthesis